VVDLRLLEKLQPVFDADREAWKTVVSSIARIPPLFWYGGAAFDRAPIVEYFAGQFPEEVKRGVSSDLFFVLTDYSPSVFQALQAIYNRLDHFDAKAEPEAEGLLALFRKDLADVSIEQMIPLTLFSGEEVRRIHEVYPPDRGAAAWSAFSRMTSGISGSWTSALPLLPACYPVP
jgi:hypothetical protein